ncbi:hypothetical protein [Methanoregula sp.]|uniref:hypothetical protein n=1 Tax=Methanoregula sp. TaxID=2052170 RepID=UPI002C1C1AEC|nr:hypothetical protein [Methanoregula sp.]HVP97096.1 hypothetical protein [Methanoregula sp.]
MDETNTCTADESPQGARNPSWISLVLVPLVIVLIWAVENYLLAGTTRLFWKVNLFDLVLYSALSAILVGIIVPFVRIRAAFLSGAVNMFQIGFRSSRRTLIAVGLTALACYLFLVFTGIPGRLSDWLLEGGSLFLLFLPTATAAVMICWAMVGTHIQAYVRSEGVTVSVLAGILITALIFALSLSTLFTDLNLREVFIGLFVSGCISAFFFFAVRDVYATIIVVTFGLVILFNTHIDPAYLTPVNPVVVLCGFAVVMVLVGVHWHFSRHYTTIQIPQK